MWSCSMCIGTLLIFVKVIKKVLQSQFSPFLSFARQSGLYFVLLNKTWRATRDGICLRANVTMKATSLSQSIQGNVQSKASGLSSSKIKRK